MTLLVDSLKIEEREEACPGSARHSPGRRVYSRMRCPVCVPQAGMNAGEEKSYPGKKKRKEPRVESKTNRMN